MLFFPDFALFSLFFENVFAQIKRNFSIGAKIVTKFPAKTQILLIHSQPTGFAIFQNQILQFCY